MPVAAPTSGFIDALRFGATLVLATVTIRKTGVPVEAQQLPISTAHCTVTRSAAHRRTLTMTAILQPTVPPSPLWPTSPSALLAPFGTEVYVKVGIATANGKGGATVKQWVPWGLFALATTTAQDTTDDAVVTLQGYDRSWTIAQHKFKGPYNVPATTTGTFVAEITHLLNTIWTNNHGPGKLAYNIAPTTAKVPQAAFNQGTTPWTAAQQMANAVGYELFFNATGVVTGYPTPTPAKQPVSWNFTTTEQSVYGYTGTGGTGHGGSEALTGSPYSVPVGVTVQFTRTGIYNDVVVTGTGQYQPTSPTYSPTTPPVLGEAKTTNPNSATYVTGPMGDVVEFVQTNLVSSTATALQAAENMLQTSLSDAWQITLTIPPNPMFDVDDVVTVTRKRLGLTNLKMVIDTVTHTVSYADLTSITGRVVPG